MMELTKEDGSLRATCVKCGKKLEKTTLKLQELSASGEFEVVDVLCESCGLKLTVGLQLGRREFGA